MPTNDAKLSLRLPSGLRDALEKMADQDRRSLNAQILVLLEKAVKDVESTSAATEASN